MRILDSKIMSDIRIATNLDAEVIREIYLSAFAETENQLVASLALNLLNQSADSQIINWVVEVDGVIAGHVAFSPVFAEARSEWQGYILAPLAIQPTYQKHGLGTQLVKNGIAQLAQLAELEADVVFVYGDPAYYARFGFKAEDANHYIPPYPLQYPFGWQAMVLHENLIGQPVHISCVAPLCDPALW